MIHYMTIGDKITKNMMIAPCVADCVCVVLHRNRVFSSYLGIQISVSPKFAVLGGGLARGYDSLCSSSCVF